MIKQRTVEIRKKDRCNVGCAWALWKVKQKLKNFDAFQLCPTAKQQQLKLLSILISPIFHCQEFDMKVKKLHIFEFHKHRIGLWSFSLTRVEQHSASAIKIYRRSGLKKNLNLKKLHINHSFLPGNANGFTKNTQGTVLCSNRLRRPVATD